MKLHGMKKGVILMWMCILLSNIIYAQITAGLDQNVCSSETVLDASPSTGYWTVIGSPAVFEFSNKNNTKVTGLQKGLNRLRWNYNDGGNVGTDDVYIYNDSPSEAKVSVKTIEICKGTYTITANQPVKGNGLWSVKEGGGTIETPQNFYSVINNISSGTNVFKWTTNYKSCFSSDETTIVNNTITASANDIVLCGASGNLTASALPLGGSGRWTLKAGSVEIDNSVNPTTLVTGVSVGANTLNWKVRRGVCSDDKDYTITNEKVIVRVAVASPITCDASVVVNGTVVPATYTSEWTITKGEGEIEQPASYFTKVNKLTAGDSELKYKVSLGDCFSSATVTVTNSYVSADAGEDVVECNPETNLLGNELKNGAKGQWTVVFGTGDMSASNVHNPHVTGLSNGANIYRWTVTSDNGSCSAFDEVEVKNSEFKVSAGIDQKVCNSTAALGAELPKHSAGSWSVVEGVASFNDPKISGAIVSGLSLGRNVLRWSVVLGECSANSVVVINNYDYPAYAPSDSIVCGDQITIEANTPAKGIGTWTSKGVGLTISSKNTPKTTLASLQTGENHFTWTINVEGCVKSDDVIISNGKIKASAGADQTLCLNSGVLIGNIPEGSKGYWTSNNPDVVFETSRHYYTVTRFPKGASTVTWNLSFGACSDSDVAQVTNNAFEIWAGPDIRSKVIEATLKAQDLKAGEVGTWSVKSGNGDFLDASNPGTKVADLNVGINEFEWSVDNGVCIMNDRITVIYSAFIADGGGDMHICGAKTSLKANAPISGKGMWSVLEGQANVESPSNPKSELYGLEQGSVKLEWAITQNGYTERDTIVVTNSSFNIDAGKNKTTCSEELVLGAQDLGVDYNGSWAIVYGNGAFVSKSDPTTTVSGMINGHNQFRWTVKNKYGCTAHDLVSIDFKQPPKAEFFISTQKGCTPMIVHMTNQSSADVTFFEWDFGDGTSGSKSSTSHTFHTDGDAKKYEIILSVKAENQCTAIATRTVEVAPSFELDFELNEREFRVPYAEVEANVTEGKGFSYYRWEMGDGQGYKDIESITHEYPEAGNYNIRLIARNDFRCERQISKEITVLPPKPVTSFELLPASGCPPLTVQFVNKTKYADSYMWDLSEGMTSEQEKPTKLYAFAGVYPITLTATNEEGSVSYSQTVYVDEKPIPNFSVDQNEITLRSQEVQFKNLSSGAAKYEWVFGDGTTSLEFEPAHKYKNNGRFSVVLKAATEHGCVVEKREPNFIKVDYPLAIGETEAAGVELYPNPIQDYLFVKTNNALANDIVLTIYNLKGKKLLQHKINRAEKLSKVNVSNFESGTFLATLLYGEYVQTVTLIKN